MRITGSSEFSDSFYQIIEPESSFGKPSNLPLVSEVRVDLCGHFPVIFQLDTHFLRLGSEVLVGLGHLRVVPLTSHSD